MTDVLTDIRTNPNCIVISKFVTICFFLAITISDNPVSGQIYIRPNTSFYTSKFNL